MHVGAGVEVLCGALVLVGIIVGVFTDLVGIGVIVIAGFDVGTTELALPDVVKQFSGSHIPS